MPATAQDEWVDVAPPPAARAAKPQTESEDEWQDVPPAQRAQKPASAAWGEGKPVVEQISRGIDSAKTGLDLGLAGVVGLPTEGVAPKVDAQGKPTEGMLQTAPRYLGKVAEGAAGLFKAPQTPTEKVLSLAGPGAVAGKRMAEGIVGNVTSGASDAYHGIKDYISAGAPGDLERGVEGGTKAVGTIATVAEPVADAAKTVGKVAGLRPMLDRAGEKFVGPVVRKPPAATANDLKFGRNPAAAIAREPGVTGKTPTALKASLDAELDRLGGVIDQTLSNPQVAQGAKVDMRPIIDQAERNALNSPEAKLNDGLRTRIAATAENLRTNFGDMEKAPLEAAQTKRAIGKATKWTGQPFDNEANQFLVDVYRGINDEVNARAPQVKDFNGRWADMLSASKAIERKIAFDTSRPMSMGRMLLGAGGGGVGTLVGGTLGGAAGAAAGIGVDLARTTPARMTIGRMLTEKYEPAEAPRAANTVPKQGPSNAMPVAGKMAGPAAASAWTAPDHTPPSGAGRTDLVGRTVEQPSAVKTPRPGPGERTLMAAPEDRPSATAQPGKTAEPAKLTADEIRDTRAEITKLRARERSYKEKMAAARNHVTANGYLREAHGAAERANQLEEGLGSQKAVGQVITGATKEELNATYNGLTDEQKTKVQQLQNDYGYLNSHEQKAFEDEHEMSSTANKGLPTREKIAKWVADQASGNTAGARASRDVAALYGKTAREPGDE